MTGEKKNFSLFPYFGLAYVTKFACCLPWEHGRQIKTRRQNLCLAFQSLREARQPGAIFWARERGSRCALRTANCKSGEEQSVCTHESHPRFPINVAVRLPAVEIATGFRHTKSEMLMKMPFLLLPILLILLPFSSSSSF
jgi:hypothetical protein